MHTHTDIFFIHTHRNIYMHKRTHTDIFIRTHTHTDICVYIYILIHRGNVHIIPLSFYIMSYELSFIQFTYGGAEIFLGKVILILVPCSKQGLCPRKGHPIIQCFIILFPTYSGAQGYPTLRQIRRQIFGGSLLSLDICWNHVSLVAIQKQLQDL